MAPPLSYAGPRGQPTLTIPLPLSQRGQHFGEPPSQRRMLRQLPCWLSRSRARTRAIATNAGRSDAADSPASSLSTAASTVPTADSASPLPAGTPEWPETTDHTDYVRAAVLRKPRSGNGAAIRRAVKFEHRDALPAALTQPTASGRVLAQRIEAGGIRYGLPCHRCGISRRQPARRSYCDRCPMCAGSDA